MTAATWSPTRPIMTAAELLAHRDGTRGRNYAESDDGYSDMEAEARRGWRPLSGWGADGWDLGDWPYLVVSVKERARATVDVFGLDRDTGQHYDRAPAELAAFLAELNEADRDFYEVTRPYAFQLMSNCEGDRTLYAFKTEADRSAAIDYLFVWYALRHEYPEFLAEGLSADKRDGLDAGALRVPDRFRGPYRNTEGATQQ